MQVMHVLPFWFTRRVYLQSFESRRPNERVTCHSMERVPLQVQRDEGGARNGLILKPLDLVVGEISVKRAN